MHGIYWHVGQHRTFSKLEALILARGDIGAVKFYFYDNEWQHKPWHQAPQSTLSQLVDERCRSLRSQTQHLSLWLSSGYDSVTVLNRFIALGLPLDELVVYSRRENDPEFGAARYLAHHYQQHHNASVKITEIFLDHIYHAGTYHNQHHDWFRLPGFSLRPTKSSTTILIAQQSWIQDRLCFPAGRIDITGFEKPRVNLEGDAWYAMFPDDAIYDQAGSPLRGFWLDEDAWELYHAACWSVIDWFETLPELDHDLVHRVQSNDPWYYPQWQQACGRDPVYNVYSYRGQGKGFFGQGPNSRDSVRYKEHWLATDARVWHRYIDGIKSLQNLMPNAWPDITGSVDLSRITLVSHKSFLRSRNLYAQTYLS